MCTHFASISFDVIEVKLMSPVLLVFTRSIYTYLSSYTLPIPFERCYWTMGRLGVVAVSDQEVSISRGILP
ncbi:uncharacterized protein ARMOST_20933 [Armillaria ostoyae]|uniref:Uncharacterized protein n=1 Tax=Armillaria ostoyae TaxID=47428 RepID=A0A284S8Q1_ARMOS|nr:uncharacterized protein ARMOST_20933 [Armillaria ostoyae]